jgi:hypothetical protein
MTNEPALDEIKQMVSDMEIIETFLGRKGFFVGNMLHISIKDIAACILEAALEAKRLRETVAKYDYQGGVDEGAYEKRCTELIQERNHLRARIAELEGVLRDIIGVCDAASRSAFNQLKEAVDGAQLIAEEALPAAPKEG